MKTEDYIKLALGEGQARGKDIWFKSPFTDDIEPAFKVNTETGVWYCFNTQQGGSLGDFIQALAQPKKEKTVSVESDECGIVWENMDTVPTERIIRLKSDVKGSKQAFFYVGFYPEFGQANVFPMYIPERPFTHWSKISDEDCDALINYTHQVKN